MKNTKPRKYTEAKKNLFEWSDKKNYLIEDTMLKFNVEHGMVVEKLLEIVSFKQSKWLEKHIYFFYSKDKSSCK